MFGGNATELDFYKNFSAAAFRIYLDGIALCCIQKSSCIFLQSIDKPYKAIILVPCVCILGFCGGLYTMLWAGPVVDIGSFIITIVFVTIELRKVKKMETQVGLF